MDRKRSIYGDRAFQRQGHRAWSSSESEKVRVRGHEEQSVQALRGLSPT